MTSNHDHHRAEVKSGERFEFGKNWSRFLRVLNDERIVLAERSLSETLRLETLQGKTFIDIGSGSGLFSLAARRLGARVHSFDYDPSSVACTRELKRRYFPDDPDWTVESGSVLDTEYLATLGQYDVVYSWGVLHHTGQMWPALDYVKPLVKPGGHLFIAIYNDQGSVTDWWEDVKRRYNALPRPLALGYALWILAIKERQALAGYMRGGGFRGWLKSWTEYDRQSTRGMSKWYDEIDWIGGYPYERATVEQIVDFYAKDGFKIVNVIDRSFGTGCNEFVFVREAELGEYVDSRIPGGTLAVRQFGYRVTAATEESGGRLWAKLPSGLRDRNSAALVLFRDGKLIGPASLDGQGRVDLGVADAAAAGDPVFALVPGRLVPPPARFGHDSKNMWNWAMPEYASVADDALQARGLRSPVYLFENGEQLPVPFALHDDIRQTGQGRFSHWGDFMYFAPLDNGDPNKRREAFVALVVDRE